MENITTIQTLLFAIIIFHGSPVPTVLASPFPIYNVQSYGADPNGGSDSSPAFQRAWDDACASPGGAKIYVPPGTYLLGITQFDGSSCNNRIGTIVDIRGTKLVAPSNYEALGNGQGWLQFWQVNRVYILGGTLYGQGENLWECKRSSSRSCPIGPVSLAFHNSENIRVHGLTSINSKFFHTLVDRCRNVKLTNMNIRAPRKSPNTDGIHVSESTEVSIMNSRIATGDDCISIGPGTLNLWIEEVACGPGHGISIGSLGWAEEEDGVQNVTVKSVNIMGTTNGIRIKSWAKRTSSSVSQVVFENIIMDKVENPIIIDQHYCPNGVNCPNEESGVQIRDVTYRDITGSSATEVAVKLDCNEANPCTGITLEDIELTYGGEPASASCSHAEGDSNENVSPAGCL